MVDYCLLEIWLILILKYILLNSFLKIASTHQMNYYRSLALIQFYKYILNLIPSLSHTLSFSFTPFCLSSLTLVIHSRLPATSTPDRPSILAPAGFISHLLFPHRLWISVVTRFVFLYAVFGFSACEPSAY